MLDYFPKLCSDAIYANEFLKAAREEFKYNDLKDGKMKVMIDDDSSMMSDFL